MNLDKLNKDSERWLDECTFQRRVIEVLNWDYYGGNGELDTSNGFPSQRLIKMSWDHNPLVNGMRFSFYYDIPEKPTEADEGEYILRWVKNPKYQKES